MKAATAQQIGAMLQAIDEITAVLPKLQAFNDGAMALFAYNQAAGNRAGAAAAESASVEYLTGELERLMRQFQEAAADLLGERPRIGEANMDFFTRICNGAPHTWPEIASQNGKALDLGDIGVAVAERDKAEDV